MFTYVKLKNYKSLVDFHANFTNNKKTPKKLIIIYGENGVGKSNLASAFYTLCETFRTKSSKDILNKYLEEKSNTNTKNFERFLKENFRDIEAIIKSSKTIDSQENMILEFGFKYNRKNGVYCLECDNEKIIREYFKLEISKEKNISFELKNTDKKLTLNNTLFKEESYKEEVEDLLEKYWGRHSLFALLEFEIYDKKSGYIEKKLTKDFINVFNYLSRVCIRLKGSHGTEKGKVEGYHMGQIATGKIQNITKNQLEMAENFLNEFFTCLYSDIKQVYFKKDEEKDSYTLMFKKLIHNKIIDIEFKKESAGTKALVELIPFCISSMQGYTIVIDEMDTGIHDILINIILGSLYEVVKDQVIITTHNTMLLESDSLKNCAYVFNSDKNGKKELVAITDFERLHPNLNIRKRYLSGLYGGVPNAIDIDFDDLSGILKANK